MSDLDQRLKDIINSPLFKIVPPSTPHMRDGHAVHDIDGDIEAIKQVFKEAGYEMVPEGAIPTFKSYLKQAMTGQEFYDRFNKELGISIKERHPDRYVSPDLEWLLNAARRAAGIEVAE